MNRILLTLAFLAGMVSSVNAQKFQADSQINVFSQVITAVNTATVISTRPVSVYGIDGFNNGINTLYIKLYNATVGGNCGTGSGLTTPFARYGMPAALSGVVISKEISNGVAFSNGLVVCAVQGLTDGNVQAPAAAQGTVNIYWHLLAQ